MKHLGEQNFRIPTTRQKENSWVFNLNRKEKYSWFGRDVITLIWSLLCRGTCDLGLIGHLIPILFHYLGHVILWCHHRRVYKDLHVLCHDHDTCNVHMKHATGPFQPFRVSGQLVNGNLGHWIAESHFPTWLLSRR